MNSRHRWTMLIFWVGLQAVALTLLFTTPVSADDCLSDPFNAADCMRTGAFRQGISVLTSLGGTVGVILINALSTWASSTAAAGSAAAASAASAAAASAAAPGSTAAAPVTSADPPVSPPAGQEPTPAQTGQDPGLYDSAESGVVSGVQSPWFDLVKNLVGPASTITGTLSEFFTFPDSGKVVDAIRDAARLWRANPTKQAAEEYIQAIRNTRDIRLKNLAEKLDLAGKAVDVIDAVGNGLNKANERGFTGVDKALTVGAEIGKKGLTWMLTKNPVVGLVDAAVGGATQMAWGKDGRIDIGGTIDKGADAWDKTTQEYFNNTLGGSEADARLQTQDQFLHLIRRIKEQVNQGKITREVGSQRMRSLRDRMFGGES